MKDIRAIILDLDGLVVDTEPIHRDCFRKVLKEQFGIDYTDEKYRVEYLGLSDREFLDKVLSEYNIKLERRQKNKLIEMKEESSLEVLKRNIPLIKGVKSFVEKMVSKYPLAICTGGLKKEVMFILDQLGWNELFNPIITSADVRWGKPHPQGYVLAYEGLCERKRWTPILQPRQCLALEDSPKGVQSAKGAGITCVAVTNSYTAGELGGADKVVDSLDQLVNEL